MTDDDPLLDYAGIATLTGLTRATLRRYRSIGLLPPPDELPVPDRPRWRTSTITAWAKARPGRGAPGHPRGNRGV
jgi:predicted DNA-binding transcriptional regulator AlpA